MNSVIASSIVSVHFFVLIAPAISIDDDVKLGDEVIIFGDMIGIREIAGYTGVNVYKLICSVTYRVPRVYIYNGKRIEENEEV